jgi:hypothetical protein
MQESDCFVPFLYSLHASLCRNTSSTHSLPDVSGSECGNGGGGGGGVEASEGVRRLVNGLLSTAQRAKASIMGPKPSEPPAPRSALKARARTDYKYFLSYRTRWSVPADS